MADLQHQVVFWDNIPEPPDFDSDPIEKIVDWLEIFNLPSSENRKIINQIYKERSLGESDESQQVGQG